MCSRNFLVKKIADIFPSDHLDFLLQSSSLLGTKMDRKSAASAITALSCCAAGVSWHYVLLIFGMTFVFVITTHHELWASDLSFRFVDF